MSAEGEEAAIVLDLDLLDAALAKRLLALLGSVKGLRMARKGEPADVRLLSVQGDLDPPPTDSSLTARETEVLELLAEGASNRAIARRLGISTHTAKFHVGRLIDKLDAIGRTDAVAHAARLGILHL